MKKALFLLIIGMSSLVHAQWPQWRGPMRDGASTETNLLKSWPAEGPKLLWSTDAIGDGFSSAIIHNKIIYVTGTKDSTRYMSALDLSGKIVWQKEIGMSSKKENMGECSTPTLYKGKLYTVNSLGEICCVDSRNGSLKWKINIPDKFGVYATYPCESPLVVDDKVIVTPCGKNSTMIALNRATGETIWKSESIVDSTAYASPVLVETKTGKLVVTITRNELLAVDLNTGKIKWHEKKKTRSFIPLSYKNQVYFPSCKMVNISSDLNNFTCLWDDTLGVKNWGGAIRVGDRLYGTNERGSGIFALDWKTGKRLAFNKGVRGGNLLAADGMIYCYEDKRGRVSLIKPMNDDFEIVGSFKVELGKEAHLAHMAIGSGTLLVRHGEALMAYDIKR